MWHTMNLITQYGLCGLVGGVRVRVRVDFIF